MSILDSIKTIPEYCDKCGNKHNIDVHYFRENELMTTNANKPEDNEYVSSHTRNGGESYHKTSIREHLKCTCRRCNYTWRINTRDNGG